MRIKYSTFIASLTIFVYASTLVAHPPKQQTPSVIYLIEWDSDIGIKDTESTSTSVGLLKRCYSGRCAPYEQNNFRLGCPPRNLCEIVVIKEIKLQGGGYR